MGQVVSLVEETLLLDGLLDALVEWLLLDAYVESTLVEMVPVDLMAEDEIALDEEEVGCVELEDEI